MSENPKKPARAAKAPRREQMSFDFFQRLRAVAPDPDGESLWVLLDPPKDSRAH